MRNSPEIAHKLDRIRDELSGLGGNTDDIEQKLDSVISELQDVEADTEANTAQLQDVNTELDSIDALLDELEDSLETVGTDEIRTTIYGDQPDGDRVPRLADGVAFESAAELNAGETYESPWVDTDQYKSLEIFISSDVTSAPDGIQIQFTEDVQAATPNVRGEINKTFDNAAVSRGFLLFNFPPRLDGYRVRYTNGGTDTSSFFISSIVRNRRSEPAGAPVTSEIEPKQSVQLSRAIIAGQDIDDNSKNVRVLDIDNTFPNLNGEQISVFTYLSRALQNAISLDQLRVDVENNNAGMATEATLSTISDDVDEVEVKLDTVISELQDIQSDLGFGDTIFGTSTGVVEDTTSTVVSYSPSSTEAITGFTGNGEADANWTLYINSSPKASQWSNQAEPNADFEFDNSIEVDSSDTVELQVENIGLRTADYEGTILIRL